MNHGLIIGTNIVDIKYLGCSLIVLLRGAHFAVVKRLKKSETRLKVLLILIKLLRFHEHKLRIFVVLIPEKQVPTRHEGSTTD